MEKLSCLMMDQWHGKILKVSNSYFKNVFFLKVNVVQFRLSICFLHIQSMAVDEG